MSEVRFEIGQEVVRTEGTYYAVGMVGTIISIDSEKRRAQVKWNRGLKTWVTFDALALTSIPYEIIIVPVKAKYGNDRTKPAYRIK